MGKRHINYAIDKGYASGYEDKTFKPNGKVTMAEFVSFLNNFFKTNETFTTSVSDSKYSDVEGWYKDYILMAESLGALPYELKGDSFLPSAEINREEVAGLTHAYLTALRIKENSYGSGQIDRTSTENVKSSLLSSLELVNNNSSLRTNLYYKDSDNISEFYSLPIFSLANEKIISGYPDGSYKPKESISRAEAINILLAAKGEKIENNLKPIEEKNSSLDKAVTEDQLGFINKDGATYYKDAQKGIVKGWNQIGESLYYFSPIDGKMYKDGLFSTGEGVYWFGPDGKIKTGKRPGGHVGRKISWSYPTAKELENNWLRIPNSEARFKAQEIANFADFLLSGLVATYMTSLGFIVAVQFTLPTRNSTLEFQVQMIVICTLTRVIKWLRLNTLVQKNLVEFM